MKRGTNSRRSDRLLQLARLTALLLLAGPASAAVLSVPSQYPTVKAAYTNAAAGDTIEIQPGLYLEMPPTLFDGGKHVFFVPTAGRTIITANVPPANDEFAGRTLLTGATITAEASNYAATTNASDPPPASAGGNPLRFGKSLWWSWTAPTSGLAFANTVGSDFPALLDVFKGNSYPPQVLSEFIEREWSLPNEIGFFAIAGESYPILVGGEWGASGQVVLNVGMLVSPANDDFRNAFDMVGAELRVAGSTLSATQEPSEPNHASQAAGHSVWFRWTAPEDGAPFARPVTLSLAGSDFDTLLAVYAGTNLDTLVPVASNDDRSAREQESQVTFTPAPGMTYSIAVDGSAKALTLRQRMGNYLLRLDYSTVNLQTQSLTTQTNGLETSFQAELAVRDWGLAPTGPLQVRLVARPGQPLAGVHHADPSTETNLAIFPLPGNGELLPNQSKLLTVSGVCPGPFIQDGHTNIWGVFAILEEKFAGTWVSIDDTFLLYGLVPEIVDGTLSYGLGRPVPTAFLTSELNNYINAGIRLSNYATDNSTNQFYMIAQLTTSQERTITNATWTGTAGFNLTSSGLLRIGELAQTTSLMVTGRFSLSGVWQTRRDTVPVYMRPRLTLLAVTTPSSLQLNLAGDLGRAYVLETTTDLPSANWQPLQTNVLAVSPTTLVLPRGPETRRLYRVRFTP